MKKLSALLIAALVVLLGAMWFVQYSENSESHFQTYRELKDSELISKGWVPAFIPKSAYDFHERHRVDESDVNVVFRYQPGDTDLPPAVRPPVECAHADKLIGVTMRVSGAGGRYPSALCGRCVLY